MKTRSTLALSLAAGALAAAGCGGPGQEELARTAAERTALLELEESSFSAGGEAFTARTAAARIREVRFPDDVDFEQGVAQARVSAEVTVHVAPRDRDDGRRLTFPASGQVRVPVTLQVPVTSDADGRWVGLEDDVDAEERLPSLSERDAVAAGDFGAEAVVGVLTYDGDADAYARRQAERFAVKPASDELPASDVLGPPPTLAAEGYAGEYEWAPEADGPYLVGRPDDPVDDVPLTTLLAGKRAADDGCKLRLDSIVRAGRPTVRVEGTSGDGLLHTVTATGRVEVTASSFEGCQEEAGFFEEEEPPYDLGKSTALVTYEVTAVRPSWAPGAPWRVADLSFGEQTVVNGEALLGAEFYT